MKDWNSVEEKWRDQLHSKSDDIPEGLWSRIEERLEEKPARRFPIYWAVAAMLLIAFGLSWNWQPESVSKTANVTEQQKTDIPANQGTLHFNEKQPPKVIYARAELPISDAQPAVKSEEQAVIIAENLSTKDESVANSTPITESKSEPEEVVTVRLDIDPIVEEVKPVASTKRKRTLFGKILSEIGQVLDGEPVNWQKLKEGNPALENNIHSVANTYLKTEENLKRTLQIQ